MIATVDASSTMAPELAAELNQRLALKPQGLERVAAQADGAWFRAHRDGDPVLIRVVPGHLDELGHERVLAQTLSEGHFPTPVPLSAPLAVGRVTATVFPHVTGERLPATAVDPDAFESVGEELGKLHRLANAVPGALPPFRMRRAADRLLTLVRHPDCQIGEAAAALRAKLSEPDVGLLPSGPLHGVFGPEALRWLGGRISAVLGLHRAGVGPWIFDLGYAVAAFCCEARKEDSAVALVRGYERQRPLLPVEREAFPRVLAFAAHVRGVDRVDALATVGEGAAATERVERALASARWALEHGRSVMPVRP